MKPPFDSRSIPAFLTLFLIFSGTSFAETIRMKDGRTLDGEIMYRGPDSIQIATKEGYLTISKDDILEISQSTIGDLIGSNNGKNSSNAKKSNSNDSTSAQPTFEQLIQTQKENSSDSPDFAWAMFRSTVWPGWGQFYQKREGPGYLFFASFGILGLNHIVLELENQQKKTIYEDESQALYTEFIAPTLLGTVSTNSYPSELIYWQIGKLNSAKNDYTKSVKAINNSASLLLGIYLINLGDAFYFHPDTGAQTSMVIMPDGIGIRMTWNF